MIKGLLFPGQGVQVIGMGKDLYETFLAAKEVFQEVDDALEQRLSRLIFEGDQKELTRTANAQPAIMAVSIAALRVLEKEGKVNIWENFSISAGHSLGEYSALCAAGVFDVQTTAKLLKIRGESMQQAVPEGLGSMIALLGGSIEKAEELAEYAAENEICVVANDNSSEQTVLSGSIASIERAALQAAEFGFKRAIKLDVSAPFHSPLMSSAAEKMAQALGNVDVQTPKISIISNVTARIVHQPNIKELLIEQICGRVRWRETMLEFKNQGVTRVIEIGQGKVLSGLAKRIVPDIETFSLQTPADFENLIKII